MLEFKLTRHHAGLVLWGDYAALERAHGLVHRVVEESPVIDDKEGFVLGLAYDLRKAFEGQRSKAFRSDPDGSRCRIYGVEILWPVILVQVGLLRQAMGFIVTNRLDQSIMFELEHVVETAVRAAEPGRADEILEWMGRVGSAPYSHLAAVLDSRCRYFIECPPTKRGRRPGVARLQMVGPADRRALLRRRSTPFAKSSPRAYYSVCGE